MKRYTLKDFNSQFPNEDVCLEWLRQKRFPTRIECPICHKMNKFHRVRNRKVYECDYCGYQISPMAGTILEKTTTPLRDWFYAIFLMASTRTGISAKQLERELGVTYKTAWRMFTKIRKLMAQDSASLFGQVEVDETYIGGKRPGKRGRGASGKTVVVGMAQRGGKAVAKVAPNVKAKTLIPMVQGIIANDGRTTVFTDDLPSYNRLSKLGYPHEIVQHSAKQYVNGTAHVNNVESLWSHIKRGISGVHHSVSPKHLQGYLDSYVFRFNHRSAETPMFQILMNRLPLGMAYQGQGTLLP